MIIVNQRIVKAKWQQMEFAILIHFTMVHFLYTKSDTTCFKQSGWINLKSVKMAAFFPSGNTWSILVEETWLYVRMKNKDTLLPHPPSLPPHHDDCALYGV